MLTRVGSTCTTSYISRIILPSSCLLWQIGGSTCTPSLIELLIIFILVATAKNKDLGSTCTPLKPDLGPFEICLNYGMLTRVGSTCTTFYISRLNFLFLLIVSNSWQIDSTDLFIIFILLSITNLGSTCTPLKSDFGFIESCRIHWIVTPQGSCFLCQNGGSTCTPPFPYT